MSRTEDTPFTVTVSQPLPTSGWPPGKYTDVLFSPKGLLLADDGQRCVYRCTGLSLMCEDEGNLAEASEVPEAISGSGSYGIRSNGHPRPIAENRTETSLSS